MHAKERAYKVGERVMPTDVTDKERKLARPYHGFYRILALIPTMPNWNLLIGIHDPSISVALDRLCPCYPEIPNSSWTSTGHRKTCKQKSKCGDNNPTVAVTKKVMFPFRSALSRRCSTIHATVIIGINGISSLSFLYHLLVFVQLEDKRHPQRGEL